MVLVDFDLRAWEGPRKGLLAQVTGTCAAEYVVIMLRCETQFAT